MRYGNFSFGTGYVYLIQNFIYHILIVVFKMQGIFYGKTSADVEAIQRWTDFFKANVNLQTFHQFVPIIRCVANSGIDKKMQHFQVNALIVLYLFLIKRNDVFVANSQSRSIEFKFWFFFRSNPDS